MRKHLLRKIISGGQTGADRAGLDAAYFLKIPTGGFCPKGYLTENGFDISLKKYHLKEMSTKKYDERTIKNVTIGDGTVIFCKIDENEIVGDGSKLTYDAAISLGKPVILNPTKKKFLNWLEENKIQILNIAGNRESQYKGLYNKTKKFLINALS